MKYIITLLVFYGVIFPADDIEQYRDNGKVLILEQSMINNWAAAKEALKNGNNLLYEGHLKFVVACMNYASTCDPKRGIVPKDELIMRKNDLNIREMGKELLESPDLQKMRTWSWFGDNLHKMLEEYKNNGSWLMPIDDGKQKEYEDNAKFVNGKEVSEKLKDELLSGYNNLKTIDYDGKSLELFLNDMKLSRFAAIQNKIQNIVDIPKEEYEQMKEYGHSDIRILSSFAYIENPVTKKRYCIKLNKEGTMVLGYIK